MYVQKFLFSVINRRKIIHNCNILLYLAASPFERYNLGERYVGRGGGFGDQLIVSHLACALAAITRLTFGLITTSRGLTARSVTSLFLSRNCILVFLLVNRITPVSCQFVCTTRVTTAPRRRWLPAMYSTNRGETLNISKRFVQFFATSFKILFNFLLILLIATDSI